MKRVVILGAGLIGKTIAADLCNRCKVVCADIDKHALEKLQQSLPVETVEIDFTDTAALRALIEPCDLVIGAVPGFLGYQVLSHVIEAGKNVVDISFFPEDPFLLDQLAKANNVTAIVDCGVAPGLCNILAGHHNRRAKLSRYDCIVGGLPVVRKLPYEYKAVFSPADVLEEYTRPARYIADGQLVEAEALSDIETVFFNEVGDLESFNTDGLRTLMTTLKDTRNMKEKTLRYPGHAALMKIFRDSGFFSKKPMKAGNASIAPLEVTSRLLFPEWKMNPGDEDFTVMRVTLEDSQHQYQYTLLDRYDRTMHTSSMARTTGYTCTAAATLLLENKFSKKGINPPEYIGADENCFREIMNYLSERNVRFEVTYTPQSQTVNA